MHKHGITFILTFTEKGDMRAGTSTTDNYLHLGIPFSLSKQS